LSATLYCLPNWTVDKLATNPLSIHPIFLFCSLSISHSLSLSLSLSLSYSVKNVLLQSLFAISQTTIQSNEANTREREREIEKKRDREKERERERERESVHSPPPQMLFAPRGKQKQTWKKLSPSICANRQTKQYIYIPAAADENTYN
jgi:hypothetical protein